VVHINHLLGRWHALGSVKVILDTSLGKLAAGASLNLSQRETSGAAIQEALQDRCTAIHLELPPGWQAGAKTALGSMLDALEKSDIPNGHFRLAREGDLCGRCDGKAEVSLPVLKAHRGIELGHAFYLGTKYSAKLEAQISTKDAAKTPMIMGCFGLGLGRIMAGVVEVSHDKDGIIWPPSLAPYRLCIITDKAPQLLEKARQLSSVIIVSIQNLTTFSFPRFSSLFFLFLIGRENSWSGWRNCAGRQRGIGGIQAEGCSAHRLPVDCRVGKVGLYHVFSLVRA